MLGASADTVELNQKFSDKEKYTFPLLSDSDKKLVTALGIKGPGGNAMRVTYVIDKDGKIAKTFYGYHDQKAFDELVQRLLSESKPADGKAEAPSKPSAK